MVVERDRIWTLLSFAAFGIYSMLNPTPSMADLPIVAEWSTYVLFTLATPVLAIGAFSSRRELFVLGHLVVIAGLLTVGGVVLFTSESPVGVLILGYACAMSYSLQKTLRERRILEEIVAETATTAVQGGP